MQGSIIRQIASAVPAVIWYPELKPHTPASFTTRSHPQCTGCAAALLFGWQYEGRMDAPAAHGRGAMTYPGGSQRTGLCAARQTCWRIRLPQRLTWVRQVPKPRLNDVAIPAAFPAVAPAGRRLPRLPPCGWQLLRRPGSAQWNKLSNSVWSVLLPKCETSTSGEFQTAYLCKGSLHRPSYYQYWPMESGHCGRRYHRVSSTARRKTASTGFAGRIIDG